MKKGLSLLLVLVLLLGLVGCQGLGKDLQMQSAQTEGTTEPLFWPPLPTGTEETAEPNQAETAPTQQEQEQDQPVATKPATTKPTESSTDATYIPREDEDLEPTRGEVIERPDDSNPSTPADTKPAPTEPAATEPAATQPAPTEPPAPEPTQPSYYLDPNGTYDSKEDVALFIRTYRRLPNNYYTKSKAESLFGWEGGALSLLEPGACIGGDRFYNNKGLIKGYTYYECDIDTIGRSKRGAKRLVFAYNGPIYYTDDHYDTFTLLYGEP